jgi:hypothetical protein
MPGGAGMIGGAGIVAEGGFAGAGPVRPRIVSRTIQEVITEPIDSEEQQRQEAFQKAIQDLKDAKDDEARKSAINIIKGDLMVQFDKDYENRGKELSDVEDRTGKLRKQLEKRKAAKSDILSLKLTTIENKAKGLEFPGSEDSEPQSANDPNLFRAFPGGGAMGGAFGGMGGGVNVQGGWGGGMAGAPPAGQRGRAGGGMARARNMPGGGGGMAMMMASNMMGGGGSPMGLRSRTVTRTVLETVYESIPDDELDDYHAFNTALETLKTTEKDEDRKKAVEVIRTGLAKQFDRDLAEREKGLASLEERIQQLKTQLTKRKAAKDDIVALRLKTIVNTAEGLEFPGEDSVHLEHSIHPLIPGMAPVAVPAAPATPAGLQKF